MAKKKLTKEEKQKILQELNDVKKIIKSHEYVHVQGARNRGKTAEEKKQSFKKYEALVLRVVDAFDNPVKPNYKKAYKVLDDSMYWDMDKSELVMERFIKLLTEHPKVTRYSYYDLKKIQTKLAELKDPALKRKHKQEQAEKEKHAGGNIVGKNRVPTSLEVIKESKSFLKDKESQFIENHQNLAMCPSCSSKKTPKKTKPRTTYESNYAGKIEISTFERECPDCGFKYKITEKVEPATETTSQGIQYYEFIGYRYEAISEPHCPAVTELLNKISKTEKFYKKFESFGSSNPTIDINIHFH